MILAYFFLKFFNRAVTSTIVSGKMSSLEDVKRILDDQIVESWYIGFSYLIYSFLNISAQQNFTF